MSDAPLCLVFKVSTFCNWNTGTNLCYINWSDSLIRYVRYFFKVHINHFCISVCALMGFPNSSICKFKKFVWFQCWNKKLSQLDFRKRFVGIFEKQTQFYSIFSQHDTSKFWKHQSQCRNKYQLESFSKTKMFKSEKD